MTTKPLEATAQTPQAKEHQASQDLSYLGERGAAKAIQYTKMPKQKEEKEKAIILNGINTLKNIFQTSPIKSFSSEPQAKIQQYLQNNHLGKNDAIEAMNKLLETGDIFIVKKEIDAMNATLQEFQIPYDIIFLAIIESEWKKNATSKTGARGYRQLTPIAIREINDKDHTNYSLAECRDIKKSTQMALRYIKIIVSNYLLPSAKKYQIPYNSDTLSKWAWYAYNAGPNQINKQFISTRGNIGKFTTNSIENKKYVPKILAGREYIHQALAEGRFHKLLEPKNLTLAKPKKSSPQIEKQPHHQGFSYLRDSSDGKYHVYAYQILSGGTPAAVKAKFGKQYPSAAKSLDTLLVTDSKGNIYPPHTHFKANTTIYLKQPKVPSTQKRKNSRV